MASDQKLVPDFSVIIASYNVAPYIKDCIESALAQTDVKLEVVVVDDCSSDGTWDIIQSINDPRLVRQRLLKNQGPSVARNHAIEMSRGKYLAILDGDDQFLPGRLKRSLHHFDRSNAHIVVDNILVNENGKTYPMFNVPKDLGKETLSLAHFFDGYHPAASSWSIGFLKPIFSKQHFQSHKLEYDPALYISEDYQLLAEALATGAKCVIEPEIGYKYKIRPGSTSQQTRLHDVKALVHAHDSFASKYSMDVETLEAYHRRGTSLRRKCRARQLFDTLKVNCPFIGEQLETAYRALRRQMRHTPLKENLNTLSQ